MPTETPANKDVDGIEFRAEITPPYREILSPGALAFLVRLHREFDGTRKKLLARRKETQAAIDRGEMPDFPAATRNVREGDWKVAPIPGDMKDRRVEITGPVDRKMVINALNSGANTYMADFEDANSPTWDNNVSGQINLRDAVRRNIEFTNPDGKEYRLNDRTATLLVRPRGWHLPEKHVLVDGQPISGSLFDFGLFFFHNARELLERGSGPYFYLPKLENHLEARLWNDVFALAQKELGIPHGSIRATVLIEHILATFEAEEILYELRDHSSGLNCGRWDYIFSFIKKFRHRPDFVLPDRAQVTMTRHFMRSYSLHVIKVCHRRGAHAMGGMAAQIPIKNDPAANDAALEKVREDKRREAGDGHDGTWVAHPALVPIAREIFDQLMPRPNQIDRQRDDVNVTAADLLKVPDGTITEQGVRTNVNVGVAYLASWLGGNGCVPLYNLMEDAATAEISRTQLWQWIHHDKGVLDDGRKLTVKLFRGILREELDRWKAEVGADRYKAGGFEQAAEIFDRVTSADELPEFLTLPAYDHLD